jgi:ribonuclease HII
MGPVIGPLVVAGVLFYDFQVPRLQDLGVRDSKALTPGRRQRLFEEVKGLALKHEILEFSPSDVDKVVFEGRKLRKLNWLEAEAMAQIIRKLKPEIAYVDASDVDEERFGRQIREMLPFEVEVVSEHHADARYTIVGAASIIAKVHRDRVISSLRERYGDFGSGYSSDTRTRRFLANWIRERGSLPDFVRKSWKTVKRLKDESEQQRL